MAAAIKAGAPDQPIVLITGHAGTCARHPMWISSSAKLPAEIWRGGDCQSHDGRVTALKKRLRLRAGYGRGQEKAERERW